MVASAIVDKYIGESARIIREMFGYAKEHQPCIIFMDEKPSSTWLTRLFLVHVVTTACRHSRSHCNDTKLLPAIVQRIDAIGGKRFSQGTSADREIQRTLMEPSSIPLAETSKHLSNAALNKIPAPCAGLRSC